jgi:uncharacterized protein with PQ loop repeat
MDAFPVMAGTVSTVIFGTSMLPMLVKAARTKDLSSYSLGNIVLANVGNVVHSIYVFHLPAGPVWALHTFYLVTTALMLVWYLRYTEIPTSPRRADVDLSPDAAAPLCSLTWQSTAQRSGT